MRLLVSAGGTGGGVYPALAVVATLDKRAEVLWIGSEEGMEIALVKRAGYAFQAVPAAGLHGVGLRNLPGNLIQILKGIFASRKIIRKFQPDVLFLTGGFVSVPVAFAGWGIPKVMFVPDIEPALALRLIRRIADVITVSTETSRSYYSKSQHVVVTGYPTRREFDNLEWGTSRRRLNLSHERSVVLVFGGSRGARSINQALWGCLESLLEKVQVVHITGELDWSQVGEVQINLPGHLAADYHPYAYLHEEMGDALASADLVVSRAGAATLGEFANFGLPAIVVPYPHAWRYQKTNASYLVEHGAAIQVADEELVEKLLPTIEGLLADPKRMQAMAAAARTLARPEAANVIAVEIEGLVKRAKAARG